MSKSITPWILNLVESLLTAGNDPQRKNKANLRQIMGPKIAQVYKVYEPLSCIVVSDKINFIHVFLTDALVKKLGSQFNTQTFKFSSVRLKSYHLTTAIHASADRDYDLVKKNISLPLAIQCDDLELMSGPDSHILGNPCDINRDERAGQLVPANGFHALCTTLAQAQFALNQLPNYDHMLYDAPDFSKEPPSMADCMIDQQQQAILHTQNSYDLSKVIQHHKKRTSIYNETQTEENEDQFLVGMFSPSQKQQNATQGASDTEEEEEKDGIGMDLLGTGKMIIGGLDVFHSDHSTANNASNKAIVANNKKKLTKQQPATSSNAAHEVMTQTASQDDSSVLSVQQEIVMNQCSQNEEPIHHAKQKAMPASQTTNLSQFRHESLILSQQPIEHVPDSSQEQSPPETQSQSSQQQPGNRIKTRAQLTEAQSLQPQQTQGNNDSQSQSLLENTPSTRFTRQQLAQRSFQVPTHLTAASKGAVLPRGKALEGRKLIRYFTDGKAPQRGYIKRFLTPTYRLVWSNGTEATNYFFEIENWIVLDDAEKVTTANWGPPLTAADAPVAVHGNARAATPQAAQGQGQQAPAAPSSSRSTNTQQEAQTFKRLHNELNAMLDQIDEESVSSTSSENESITFYPSIAEALKGDAKRRKVNDSQFARDSEDVATQPQLMSDLQAEEEEEADRQQPAGKKRQRDGIKQPPLQTLRQQQAKNKQATDTKVSGKKRKHEQLQPATELIGKILQHLNRQKRVRGDTNGHLKLTSPSSSAVSSLPRPLNLKQPTPQAVAMATLASSSANIVFKVLDMIHKNKSANGRK